MLERFRLFLDRPLEPSAGRAILALAAAILIGLALLFVLAAGGSGHHGASRASVAVHAALARTPAPSPPAGLASPARATLGRSVTRQDPQDQRGAAAKHAREELRSHRALQHVPYRRGRLRIALAGARGGKALLRVSAPTAVAAWRGWRAFLRRYRDSGHSYAPVFDGRGGGAR